MKAGMLCASVTRHPTAVTASYYNPEIILDTIDAYYRNLNEIH